MALKTNLLDHPYIAAVENYKRIHGGRNVVALLENQTSHVTTRNSELSAIPKIYFAK